MAGMAGSEEEKVGSITTATGERFTGNDSCNLAWLIYSRWGRDIPAAASAYRRLMQNSCSDTALAEMVRLSPMQDEER